ncbi:hypothetical protein RFF67_08335 [Streptococcus ruminantium]|nr:putative cross-wall-targeting lipoprotein signal domain-containing proteiin [Streptococcus ruminantium]MDQ8817091.1 hypothetical protein [Streptococcus ruminantium]
MTKTCNHHFLVNQEKGEKHVFRKSKKYRTLCSVALGTMVTLLLLGEERLHMLMKLQRQLTPPFNERRIQLLLQSLRTSI